MTKLKDMSDRERAIVGRQLSELITEKPELDDAMGVIIAGTQIKHMAHTRAVEMLGKAARTPNDLESLVEVFQAAVQAKCGSLAWVEKQMPGVIAESVMPFITQLVETAGSEERQLADQLAAAQAVCQARPPVPLRIDNKDLTQRPGVCRVIAHSTRVRVNNEVEMLWKWSLRNNRGVILLGGGTKAHEHGAGIILPPKTWLKACVSREKFTAMLIATVERLNCPCNLVLLADWYTWSEGDPGFRGLESAKAIKRITQLLISSLPAINATGIVPAWPGPENDRAMFIPQLRAELEPAVEVIELTTQD